MGSPRRLTSVSYPTTSARPSSRLPSTPASPVLVTGLSFIPARCAPVVRLARTPVLEMVALLLCVRLSQADGQWWAWSPGALDALLTSPGSMSRCHNTETGSTPTECLLMTLDNCSFVD